MITTKLGPTETCDLERLEHDKHHVQGRSSEGHSTLNGWEEGVAI